MDLQLLRRDRRRKNFELVLKLKSRFCISNYLVAAKKLDDSKQSLNNTTCSRSNLGGIKMSEAVAYSLFSSPEDDPAIDLSWILKLVDNDPNEIVENSSSTSSSPERGEGEISSGYSSGRESFESNQTLVSGHSQEYSSISGSSCGLEADRLIFPWTECPIPECSTREDFLIFKTQHIQQANTEASFYVKALTPMNLDDPALNFRASVIHSSGFVQPVSLVKVESLPGYRCDFYPVIPGRYSASVHADGPFSRRGNTDNVHGCPLDLLISRNYTFESRSPVLESLPAGGTGSKYWGIATDKYSDMLFVTDRDTHEVIALHPSAGGRQLFRYGKNPTLNVKSLYRPTGLVCDSINKRLIICDKDNHRVVFLTLDGLFISTFGKKGHQNGEFNYPWDVDVSPSGDLIVVSDSRNHRVQMFDRFGNYLRKFSVFETKPFEYKQEFDYPRGITFDHEGKNIFVTDFNTHNVLRLTVELTESRRLIPPGKMCRPQGITVDEVGNLLVCDSKRNCIRVVTSEGNLLTTIDRVGSSHLTIPSDGIVMRGGEVATVDVFGRIRIF